MSIPTQGKNEKKLHGNIHAHVISFLQGHMFTLRLMPKVKSGSVDIDCEVQVLMGQKQQIEVFIEEAIARRRFEDVSVLRDSLKDIEEEVNRRRG